MILNAVLVIWRGVDLNSIWHFSEGFRGGAGEQWHARQSVQHSRAACRSIIWEIWALSVDDREVDSVVVDEGETDELTSEVRIGLSAGGSEIRTLRPTPSLAGRHTARTE